MPTNTYNVQYDTPRGVNFYCAQNMTYAMALRMLAKFKARYLDADGKPLPYPNGQGFYALRNPIIVEVCN